MPTTRVRSTDNRQDSVRTHRAQYGYPPWSATSSWTQSLTGTSSTIFDNNNRGFEKNRAEGNIVMGDCAISRWTRTLIPGKVVLPFDGMYGMVMSGDMIAGLGNPFTEPQPLPERSAMEPSVLVKCYAKMNTAPVMAGEILATLGQTVGMMKSPLRSATSLIGKIYDKRNKLMSLRVAKTASNYARANADAWLEYRYGWNPILMDLRKISDEVRIVRARENKRRLVVREQESFTERTSGAWSPVATSDGLGSDGSWAIENSIRTAAGVIFELTVRDLPGRTMAFLGLGAKDLPATLWELMPWSFVVDRFVGVADFISAITPNPDITVVGSWLTTVTNSESRRSATVAYGKAPPEGTAFIGTWGGEITKVFSYSRTVNPSLPYHPIPTVNKLSRLFQIDATALAIAPILAQLKGLRH